MQQLISLIAKEVESNPLMFEEEPLVKVKLLKIVGKDHPDLALHRHLAMALFKDEYQENIPHHILTAVKEEPSNEGF